MYFTLLSLFHSRFIVTSEINKNLKIPKNLIFRKDRIALPQNNFFSHLNVQPISFLSIHAIRCQKLNRKIPISASFHN